MKKSSDKAPCLLKRMMVILLMIILFFILLLLLILSKRLRPNTFFAQKYKVLGVDVSHYQGDIDWNTLAGQGISFAFIKATEGSSHVDEYFYDNWQAASRTNLAIGAYHFFSFDSPARTQAELYIHTAGGLSGKLAPVIDVEYYGDKAHNPPDKETVTAELKEMLSLLEEYYGVKPILYTTYTVYHRYIKGEFEEYPLWIRNVYYPPIADLKEKWTFWQYTDTAVLEGYSGVEQYIDMNAFCGSFEELEKYIIALPQEE